MLRRSRVTCCVGLLFALVAPLSAQDSAKATVYIYRPGKFYAKVREPSIYVDDKKVADIENGRYFALKLEPGSHMIQADERPEKSDTKIDQQWAAGTVYFVEISIGSASAFKSAYGRIVQVSEEQARTRIAKLKPSEQKSIEMSARDMVVLDRFK